MDVRTLKRIAADPTVFQAELVIQSATGVARFGDVAAPFQKFRYASLNPDLIALANGTKPPLGRHWWTGSKGSAKDHDLSVAALWLLAFTKRPIAVCFAAADQDQAGEMLKIARGILRLNPWLADRLTINNWKISCPATDSVAEVIASDVAGSHGSRIDLTILNELSHITKQSFAETILDNATKMPFGVTCIASNAGFTNTFQHQWMLLAKNSPARWAYHELNEPAPWLSAEDIEEARQRNPPARFLRLFYSVWASGAGDALDPADVAAAIDPDLRPLSRADGNLSFTAGLDLGLKHDHAALVVLGSSGATQRIRLAECQSWKPGLNGQVDLSAVEAAVLSAHRRFNLIRVVFDPWQAALLCQRLTKAGVTMAEMVFQAANLTLMANTLLDCFRSRRIDLYHDNQLLTDLGRLSIVEKSYGFRLDSTRDASGHCDLGTALAICLPAAVEQCQYGGEALIWHPMHSPRAHLDGSYMSRPELISPSRFIG